MTERQKIGAAWEHTTKETGKEYLSITVNIDVAAGSRLSMWPNGYKGDDPKKPDFILYLDPPKGVTKPADDDMPSF
jgi:hypothetical protein